MLAQTQSYNDKQNTAQNTQVPFMNTLTEVSNKMVKEGYVDNLKMTKQGLYSPDHDKTYVPEEVTVKNFYRFEGQSDPADSAILYVIETHDGVKGTLIDAYGAYADEKINKFMTEVEEISKKTNKSDSNV